MLLLMLGNEFQKLVFSFSWEIQVDAVCRRYAGGMPEGEGGGGEGRGRQTTVWIQYFWLSSKRILYVRRDACLCFFFCSFSASEATAATQSHFYRRALKKSTKKFGTDLRYFFVHPGALKRPFSATPFWQPAGRLVD